MSVFLVRYLSDTEAQQIQIEKSFYLLQKTTLQKYSSKQSKLKPTTLAPRHEPQLLMTQTTNTLQNNVYIKVTLQNLCLNLN